MDQKNQKEFTSIAVIGAGSIGMVFAAYLSQHRAVDVIDANENHVQVMNESGAQVSGTVSFTQKVKAYTPDSVPKQTVYDLVFIAVKQMYNQSVFSFLRDHITEHTALVTLQNGLPEIELSQVFGSQRVFGAAVNWGATYLNPGHCELTSERDAMSFDLGHWDQEGHPRLTAIQEVMHDVAPVFLPESFAGARWVKLLSNAGMSAMSTVLGCTFGEVLTSSIGKTYLQYLLREIILVAKASGVSRLKHGKTSVAPLVLFSSEFGRILRSPIVKKIYRPHQRLKASMLQDIEAGRKTEVEAICGVVSRMGKSHGVETPYVDQVAQIIREIEDGNRAPGSENAELLVPVLTINKAKSDLDPQLIVMR
jgi:2-dehydropantoate 2-reductase